MISSITLRNIRKKYPSSNFTFHIENLELTNRNIHVIAGANGSGKTTLLKLIAFLDRPDLGEILINGKNISFKSGMQNSLRKKVGFIMQNPYLFNMNVFENVALGLKIRRYPRTEILSKVEYMLAALKIEDLAGQSVKHLSRGEYQKTAIAQVLVLEPEVILMDEPAANIDKESTLSIEGMIKGIQKRYNPLIIMTTHSKTQARRISHEVITIKKGKLANPSYESIFFGEIKTPDTNIDTLEVT